MEWLTVLVLLTANVPLQERDPRIWARLSPAVATRIQALADSATRRRLPVEPLVQKALEGRSKGAPDDRIVIAVSALLGALESARAALGPGGAESESELVAGAEWIRAGGTRARLSGFRAAGPARPLGVAIATGTDLMTRGWTEADAADATDLFLTANATDRDLLAVRDRLEQAVRRGATTKAAVLSEFRRLKAGETRP